MNHRNFVISVSQAETRHEKIWDSRKPMAIGHPRRFVLVRAKDGIEVQDLRAPGRYFIPDHELAAEATTIFPELPFGIRPAAQIAPAFKPRVSAEGEEGSSGKIRIYNCVGSWTVRTDDLGETFKARLHGKEVFLIRRSGEEYVIAAWTEGLILKVGPRSRVLQGGQTFRLEASDMAQATISSGRTRWVFSPSESVNLPDSVKAFPDADSLRFQRSIGYSGLILVAFLLLAMLWPSSEDAKPIVEELRQIVIEKPPEKKKPSSAAQGSSGASAPAAFRDSSVASAARGLLRGGMAKLLRESDSPGGATPSDNARQVLGRQADALRTTAPITGLGAARRVEVSKLGGNGSNGAGGYGTGEHAKVTGQGQSFVSLDTSGSLVEEGLTKDEVGRVIHRHLSEVRYCYESSMLRTPDIEGKLLVAFTIGGSGAVRTAQARQSTLGDPQLSDCIVGRLQRWRFPQTKGGIDVSVTYPFIFKSLGR